MTNDVPPARSYTASLADGDSKSLWSWRMSEFELHRQVEEYDSLPPSRSSRGIAAMLTAGSVAVGVIASLVGMTPVVSVVGVVIASLFDLGLAWLIYRGRRWALAMMMVLWTLEKGYALFASRGLAVGGVIYWVIWMKFYLNAWRVEQERRRVMTVSQPFA